MHIVNLLLCDSFIIIAHIVGRLHDKCVLHEALLSLFGLLDVFGRHLQGIQLFQRRTYKEPAVLTTRKHTSKKIQPVFEQLHGIVDGFHGCLVLSAVGIFFHRLVELFLNA